MRTDSTSTESDGINFDNGEDLQVSMDDLDGQNEERSRLFKVAR